MAEPIAQTQSADSVDAAAPQNPPANSTLPVATPDNGSDFYNTPVATGSPALKEENTGDAPVNVEELGPSNPPAMIPGLGLVQPSSQEPMVNGQPVSQTTDVKMTDEASKEMPLEAAKQEPKGEDQVKSESAEAMDVDTKTIEATPDNTQVAEQPEEEQEGEHPEWEADSSPYESSSDSSTSSDSDDSDDEDYPILSPEEQARILMLAEGGSDDEGEGKGKSGGYIRSTNEIVEDVLPVPDVKITPEMKIVHLGKIQTIVENALLIEANTSGEYQVLESGSLLCLQDYTTVGVVSETLGRVENPLYTVMFSSASGPQEKGLTKDMDIYYVEEHSTFVFTQPLKGMKGSDASNFHDEEIAEDEIEFSDDEAEADYKKRLKQKRQERKEARGGGATRGKRDRPGPSKLSHSELNYDDERGQEGYTPLARPKNLHEMMGPREAPVEGSDRNPGFRGGRGRGRGSDRGRGGRGRGAGGRGRGGGGGAGGASWNQDQGRPQYGDSQSQPPGYAPQPYQQQPAYGMPQPFAAYGQQPQQPQPFAPGAAPTQFPFQFPFQQAFQQQQPQQPNSFPSIPPGAHINPLFLAALQQQQQPQQFQQPQQYQQAPGQTQAQNPPMNFDQVKAQLELLRNLSNGNQGPPPS